MRISDWSSDVCSSDLRIAEGTPLECRGDEGDYWAWRNWLHRSDATLTFPLAIMIRYTRVEPEERRLAQAVADYKAFFGGRATSIEAALADGRDRPVAGRFPIAHTLLGHAAFLAPTLAADHVLGGGPQAWPGRSASRPLGNAGDTPQTTPRPPPP